MENKKNEEKPTANVFGGGASLFGGNSNQPSQLFAQPKTDEKVAELGTKKSDVTQSLISNKSEATQKQINVDSKGASDETKYQASIIPSIKPLNPLFQNKSESNNVSKPTDADNQKQK